jgi:hypothetical protein
MDYRILGRRPRVPRRDRIILDFPHLTVARCPLCDAPMSVQYSRRGPTYHCRCPVPRSPRPSGN